MGALFLLQTHCRLGRRRLVIIALALRLSDDDDFDGDDDDSVNDATPVFDIVVP